MNIETLSDVQLYEMCRNFGAQALEARRKFIGLLPEVNRRRLYEKKGFSSIFHFAAVLAGVSEEQVRRVIKFEERFEKAPAMKNLLVTGQVSLSKINAVASLVTTETDQELADKTTTLSRNALETWVRDVKIYQGNSVPGDTKVQQSVLVVKEPNLSQEIKAKLTALEEKGIDINEIIAKALQQREQEIAVEKEKLAAKAEQKLIEQCVEEKTVRRVAPVATKKLLKKEFGSKCAILTCRNKAEVIHHTNRFSISHDHNPYYLAPLCKQHHEIAHAVDMKAVQMRR